MDEIKIYKKPISFSQNEMFWTCPRTWYHKYILKTPRVEDLVYAHRGNIVHKCLETYYPDKTISLEELKNMFEDLWKQYKLHESKLRYKKEESWNMVVNGVNLDLHVTRVEEKIYFKDLVQYLDVVNSDELILTDWKTSTRSEENEGTYPLQLIYYAYGYYRKYDKKVNKARVIYLKYTGEKAFLEVEITDKKIKQAEEWHNKTLEMMQYYIDNPEELPRFNKDYHWCPYKHLWDLEEKDEKLAKFILQIKGNYIKIKGDVEEFLVNHIDKKFSYELKNAYFMKKRYPNAKTTVRLFNKKEKKLPIGFLEQLKKTLQDYSEYKGKKLIIKIQDEREFNKETIPMPEKLLTGKELRDYQEESIDKYLNKKDGNIGILELITGAGKSLIFTEIIRRLGYKTLIVVDKKELLMQTKKVLEEELGIPIGIIGGGERNVEHVTVATIQTLIRNIEEYKYYLGTIRLCILDEAHHISSNSYYTIGKYLTNTSHRLSMTATAYRDDGNDMMITATGGDIIHSITGQTLIDKGYLMKPNIYFAKYEMTKEYIKTKEEELLEKIQGINKSQKTIDMESTNPTEEDIQYLSYYGEFIVRNNYRNKIIKYITDGNENKKILILVKSVEHGELLQTLIPGSKYIYGETNKKQRMRSMEEFRGDKLKILISTISIFAEGVDIPSLDIVINASCNKGDVKSIQTLGRVLRKKEGKETAEYYDFYDSYKFFYNASRLRVKAFKKEGHEVTIWNYKK